MFSVHSASAPYYKLTALPDAEHGVLTLENGEKWYKVRDFENDADYILTVQDGAGEEKILTATDDADSQYIWHYSRSIMTMSTAPRVSTLSTGKFPLGVSEGKPGCFYTSGAEESDWKHTDGLFCHHGRDAVTYLKYDASAPEPFSLTENKAEASPVNIYARSTTVSRCIVQQPAAESYVIEGSGYPAPEFSAVLPDVTLDSVLWFVDGELQKCSALTLTADLLADQPAGVHRVSCLITAHDSEDYYYREQSADASFVIAKGVLPDSIMTFSDVHEEYGLIGEAIETVLKKTEGLIPSLVICSGDFVYGPTAEKDTELNCYFPQIVSQLGGLDAVFVAGNHDSGAAASAMSAAANLGAEKDLPAKGGIIFSGESEAVRKNGRNSRSAKGILTYGINFDAARKETPDGVQYTYEETVRDIDSFLKQTAAHYHGELIVISAHSGLHVIGRQPESVNGAQIRLYEWMGDNLYNVDQSYALAETINRYAEQYNMDILYLFGHDHSRNEAEIFLTDGDTLISPIRYADFLSGTQKLRFTYASAGYLSSVIGSADFNFSLIYRDDSAFSYDLLNTKGGSTRHFEFKAKHPYEAPAETTAAPTAAKTETQTTAQTAASEKKADAPETGDHIYALLLTVPAAALLLSRKKPKPD